MGESVHVIPKHKPLANTPLFWSALSIPLFLGSALGILIGSSIELGSVCFKPECVQGFFAIFKFPIAIMGLSLPLVAMVAAIHRSMEAALQIDYASKQYREALINNRFGNYLKHREGFEKLVDSACERSDYGSTVKATVLTGSLYGKLFPHSSFNNFEWTGGHDQERHEYAETHAKIIVEQLKISKDEFDILKFAGALSRLNRFFEIRYKPFKAINFVPEKGEKFSVIVPAYGSDLDGMILASVDVLKMLGLFRSYIGINKVEDLSVYGCMDNIYANIKASTVEYTSKVYEE